MLATDVYQETMQRKLRARPVTLVPPKQPLAPTIGEIVVTRGEVLEFYAQHLYDAYHPEEREATSSGAYRSSELSKCTREYTYRKLKATKSNPRLYICPVHGAPDDYKTIFVPYSQRASYLKSAGKFNCSECKEAITNRANLLSAAYGDAIHFKLQAKLQLLEMIYDWPKVGIGIELTLDDRILQPDMQKRFLIELNMSGRMDAVIKPPVGSSTQVKGTPFLIGEFKTIGNHLWVDASQVIKYLNFGQNSLPSKELYAFLKKLVGYETQLLNYVVATKAPAGWLLIVRRPKEPLPSVSEPNQVFGLLDYQEWLVIRNNEVLNETLHYVRQAQALVARGENAPPQPLVGGCKYCDYRDLCVQETGIILPRDRY